MSIQEIQATAGYLAPQANVANEADPLSSSALVSSVRSRLKVLSAIEGLEGEEAWYNFAESVADDFIEGHPMRWAIHRFLLNAPHWVVNTFLLKAKFFESAARQDLDWFLHRLIDKAGRSSEDLALAKAWIKRAHHEDALQKNVADRFLPFITADTIMTALLEEVTGRKYLPDSTFSTKSAKSPASELKIQKQVRNKQNRKARGDADRIKSKKN